jgi:membrane-associated PAP2 superfamily phosphatase
VSAAYRRFTTINLIALLVTGLLFTWISRDGRLDFWLARQFFDAAANSFPWRISQALDFWGHTVLKLVTVWILVIGIVLAVISHWVTALRPWRRALFLFALMASIAPLVVLLIKINSVHSCPWDIHEFGGRAQWFPLFGMGEQLTGPGECWPGGHASGGFGLLAAYFAFREDKPQFARAFLVVSLLLGVMMSVVQMARGAHFLSHNLWTLWLIWAMCFLLDGLMRFIWPPRPAM